jgi:ketosteroid isomerase-like protein
MMRRILLVVPLLVIAGLAMAQQAGKGAADEVIAVTKAQWAAEMKKNTAEANKILAEDYTEFNSDYATRVDGKAVAARIGEAQASGSGTLLAAEMGNPKVQVYGDVAILSYNYMGVVKDKDGKIENTRAKSTRVYVKQGGQWWLVHANFGEDRPAR